MIIPQPQKVGHVWGATLYSNVGVDWEDVDYTNEDLKDSSLNVNEENSLRWLMSEAFRQIETQDVAVNDIIVFRGAFSVIVSAFPCAKQEYTGMTVGHGCVSHASGESVIGTATAMVCQTCKSVMYGGKHVWNDCPYGITARITDE